MYQITMNSPVGFLTLKADENYLTSITFGPSEVNQIETNILMKTKRQLEEYFSNDRISFDVPMNLVGTTFQKEVWNALMTIPYGETCSYQDIAIKMNKPNAVRAVGQANRKNPYPIIIPCHRVIGKNSKLVGYAGNQIDKKEYLLNHESCLVED
ncbi:methylated-DNA--[protein]-cysteine S-methyltransferase [Bacillus sp. 2205SS5-2]|uniref:methylated-DNA--[protein]-cysteine S-methyltransferase n=1 Tax=Bacillus sp. 2205SS5-2 TaxID=3109031 RepID=UPI00300726EC